MLVDKKGKNILANPNDTSEYPFKNQAELIERIGQDELGYGFQKSSLGGIVNRY